MAGANIQFIISAIDQFSQQFDNLDRQIDRAYKSAGTLGKGMMVAGAAVGAGLGLAVKTAADFEQAMSRVGALSGASAKDMDALTNQAKKLGAETSFSASQAAEGMSYLAMAGYKTNDIIAAMPGLLATAAAGQTELGATADIVSNILSGFGIKAEETARVADVMTKTFTNSNTDLQMLGYTMKYVAPVAHAAGYSLESMAAAAGVLGNAGIQADSAGTALRMMILRLAKPPKMAKKALNSLGISVSDASGNMKPLSAIIGEINEKTKGMSQAQKLATVSSISGTEASAAMLALMDAGQGTIDEFTKQLENSGGAAQEIADKQLDNLNGQLTILKSALEGAAISIGNALLPAVKFSIKVIQKMVDTFNSLPNGLKTFIAIFMAVGAILTFFGGLILWTVSLIPGFIAGFGAIAGVLGMTSGALAVTIGWVFVIIAALIALGVIIYKVYKNSDKLQAAWKKSMAAMQAAGKATLGWLNGALEATVSWIQNSVIPAFVWLGQKVSAAFKTISAAVAPVLGFIIDKLKNFGSEAQSAIGKAMNFDFSGLAEIAAKFIPSILGMLLGGIPRLLIVGMNMLSAIAEGMGITVPELMDKIVGMVTSMIDAFLAQVPAFLEMGIQFITSILNGVLAAIPGIINAMTSIVNTIVQVLTTALPQLLDAGVQILLALLDGVITALPQILTAAIQIITSLVTAIVNALPVLINAGINVLMALVGGIIQSLPILINAGMQLLTGLITGIIQVLPLLITAAVKLIVTLASALIQMLPAIIDAGIQILMALIEGIIQLLPMLIDAALQLLFAIVDALIQNLPAIIDAGIKLITALISGLIKMLPMLIAAAFKLIIALVGGIIKLLPKLLQAGVQLITALIKGLFQMVGAVVKAAFDVGKNIWEQFQKINLLEVGKNIIQGLIKGITGMAGAVKDAVVGVAKAIPEKIKNFLGIHSPSRVLMELGGFTGEGFAIGIADMLGQVKAATADMAAAAVPSVDAGNFQPVQRRSNNVADVTNEQQKTAEVKQQSAEYSFEIPVVVDGREIARATAKFTKEELDRIENNNKRAKGVK